MGARGRIYYVAKKVQMIDAQASAMTVSSRCVDRHKHNCKQSSDTGRTTSPSAVDRRLEP